MLRRSILQIASRRGLRRRIPRPITREFSAAAPKTASHHPGDAANPPPPGNGGSSAKIFLGSAAVGAGLVAAYKTGYLDPLFGAKEKSDSVKDAAIGFEDHKHVEEEKHDEERAGIAEEKVETRSDVPNVEGLSGSDGENPQSQVDEDNKAESDITSEKGLPEHSQNVNLGSSSEGNVDVKSAEEKTSVEINEAPVVSQTSADQQENEAKIPPPQPDIVQDKAEVAFGEPSGSLLKAYHLKDEADESIEITNREDGNEYNNFPNEKEAPDAIEALNDAYISKDGKLVLDFLQAIHTAEKRQAELDARVFSEEKRMLKEKYEKKLKDAAARELMLAEEAAMLDKELNRERAKAAAALKSLQEKLEEKYKTELEHKEIEAEMKLKKVEELAKAELAATIAREKASQIEKMAEANLHGALALDDALSKGLPIEREIEALHTYLEGIDKDSILDVVLSSLPEETRRNGTDTLLQLNQKFDALKGTVRHLSLIPLGGGGILAHSLAHIASWLKVKEVDDSGDGIESIINKVEHYLAEGKIAEAAEALEEGVKGTQAMEVGRFLIVFCFVCLHVALACNIYGLTVAFYKYVIAAKLRKCLTAMDGSFTTEDRLQQGRPPSPLGSQNKAFKEKEPSLDSVPSMDPRRISWCCSENGLFLALPIHFEFSYGVAKVMNLLIVGNVDPFRYLILSANIATFDVLKNGAHTSPSRFIICDSKDTFSGQVIPWAIAIACGHVVPLALLFLRLLYHELDQLHTLEKQVLSLSVVNHPRLVLEPIDAASNSNRRCPTSTEENNASSNSSQSTKKSKASGEGKPANQGKKAPSAKALTKEAAHAGPTRRTKSARASTSYGTSMPFEFLDITIASVEKWSTRETNNNEVNAGVVRALESIESPNCVITEPTAFPKKVLSTKGQALAEGWGHHGIRLSGSSKVLSPFICGMIFEELGILLYGIEHTSLLELTEHKLLCYNLFNSFDTAKQGKGKHFHVFVSEDDGIVVVKESPLQLGRIALRAIVLRNMHESFSISNPCFRSIFKLVEKGFELRVFLEDLRFSYNVVDADLYECFFVILIIEVKGEVLEMFNKSHRIFHVLLMCIVELSYHYLFLTFNKNLLAKSSHVIGSFLMVETFEGRLWELLRLHECYTIKTCSLFLPETRLS
ncbi:UBX domain-containing protein 4 [Pyrus ussuriensis x Pyrus communis]|uniref:UBX domain-containing protein 4 n=1 Tax=Pyrus ussuriensis x Pyrus communis TaxID=2448454 RepID=A0A5N5F2M7_9ROSA|nr:UBX domain-containing protein 4 [Pyrus ussuriensis x Pyrus communis]